MTHLRPLAVGELVDRSVSVWRQHWAPLFRLYLGFQLVEYLAVKSWQLLLKAYVPGALTSSVLTEQLKTDPLGTSVKVFGSLGVILLVTVFFAQVSGVALSAYVFPRHTGRGAPTVTEALATSVARLPALSSAFFLSLGWSLVVAFLFQLPGIGLMGLGAVLAAKSAPAGVVVLVVGTALCLAAAVIALLWYVIRFFCLSQIVAAEPVSGWAAFRRSNVLSSGRIEPGPLGLVKLRLTVLITVVGLVLTVIVVVTSAPSAIITTIYGNALDPAHADQTAVPAALLIPAELFQIVVSSIFSPIYAVFAVVFYVDMRVRREGLDLELALGKRPEAA